ncbi:hypothetical protein QET40_03695 [Akkermansia sp. N21169]|uniref:hypothetical protein n=1 Tax=unclassified Akkermansia TaxID=2608915 RepID=UPI00244E8E9C|nr:MULTISPECIES: hypothetical protein [unclassified Akkermansia]MDH3068208.1 hypothetical protein [Akkermansia sp. N21169]WPX40736.1 hypothetical protein QET93_001290 [Akkermansia sp. N21116]
MNRYICLILSLGCLLTGACQANTARSETVQNQSVTASTPGKTTVSSPDKKTQPVQEHRRFKRLSLPLR